MNANQCFTETRFARLLRIVDGDVLTTVRRFLTVWWNRIGLYAMLAPVENHGQSEITVRVIRDVAELEHINPFAPVMHINTASLIDEFIKNHPGDLLAVVLRPCELYTAVELQKRQHFSRQHSNSGVMSSNLVTIGIDCLGTLSSDDFGHHMEIFGTGTVTKDTIMHTMNAETIFDIRAACQICKNPEPYGADITIGLIGTDREQSLLLITADDSTDERLEMEAVTDGLADKQQLLQRNMVIKGILEQRAIICDQLLVDGSRSLADLSNLMAWGACCTLCTDCLDACPLYNSELTGALGVGTASERKRPILSELVGVSRWLTSCSGCGMCHEACEHGVPVMRLIASLSHHIQRELAYTPGDPEQPLPWTRSNS